jgi:hypothetical protein
MPRKLPYKKRGEWVEQIFLAIVMGLGFTALRPIGDSAAYDAVVEGRRGRFYRVQVKSTTSRIESGGYHAKVVRRSRAEGYTARHIDLMAVYVIPEDLWYVIPVRALRARPSIYLFPAAPLKKSRKSRFERYRRAWHLLK